MNGSNILQISTAIAIIAFGTYVTLEYVVDEKQNPQTIVASQGNNTVSGSTSRDILSYVPADTIYFLGGLEPASIKNMLDMLAPQRAMFQNINFEQQLNQGVANNKDQPPALKMIIGLSIEYMKTFTDLEMMPSTLGVGENIDAAIYSVGTIPVMRIKLTDSKAFNRFVEKAETSMHVTPELENHGEIALKTYRFSKSGNTEDDVKLAIGVNDDYALITLITPVEDQATRNVILGVEKPNNNLANSTILQDLKSKYGFHPAYLGYINHLEIMKGLTVPEGNQFWTMLGAIIKKGTELKQAAATTKEEKTPDGSPKDNTTQNNIAAENPLASIQTTACRNELMAITKLWPRTIFGYTELSLDKTPKIMTARMLIENTDAALMKELQKLRGFIPKNLKTAEGKPVFGFGIGFNIDELTPVAGKLITAFTQKDYQCQSLAEMKQGLANSNPLLALGMMTGMAAGVQGLSATVLDIDVSMGLGEKAASPDVRSIDAIVTLSAKDPKRLLLMAANFQPGMPPIQLPDDGTAVDFPLPLPTPNLGSVKLALKGNHLVAYIGDKAAEIAKSMSNEPLAATGMFSLNIDIGKYMKIISGIALTVDTAEGKLPDQSKAMLEEMAKMDMNIVESFDITSQGIVFDATMTMH
ncbi:MAG: hypothetical protein COB30_017485 [Ectothiorhodospiraceae bacterium]|nr:hypothetical protein [Ectothiorhodospiraceae bacterium]